jgi:hypothetical protein
MPSIGHDAGDCRKKRSKREKTESPYHGLEL